MVMVAGAWWRMAGGLVGLLDAVAVVPGAFDRARADALASGRHEQGGELAHVGRETRVPVLSLDPPPEFG